MARIGIIQLDILWENVAGNIDKIDALTASCSAGDFDLILLPELWPCGFTMNHTAHLTFEPGLAYMKRLSTRLACAVVGGLPARTETGQENCCYLVHGQRVERYVKMKAFKFAGEHEKYEQGDQRCRWDVAGFSLSPFVCYDLRFPELPRPMVPETDLFSYVACWPSARVHHWRALLIARAIENLAYVIGCNRAGRDGAGLDYPGASMVISPKGEVLLDAGDREGLYQIEIDPAEVVEVRRTFPFLKDI